MELINETPLPAALVPSAAPGDMMRVLFLCAATFRLGADRAGLAREQRPLSLGPAEVVPGDASAYRACASVCATGAVYPPGGEAREAMAELAVGERRHRILAVGPRTWREGLGGALVATQPLPFRAMPMTWENAFGGKVRRKAALVEHRGRQAILPAHEVMFPANPEGRGFQVDLAAARDQPLPCLEHPEQRITAWDQHPEPVCFAPYPVWGGLRVAFVPERLRSELVERRGDTHRPRYPLGPELLRRLREGDPGLRHAEADLARLESRAAPRGTFDSIPWGTPIVLAGMRPRGEVLSFALPAPPARLTLQIGASERAAPLALDAVDIDAEARVARVVYRARFTYPVIAYELRRAALRPGPDFPASPVEQAR